MTPPTIITAGTCSTNRAVDPARAAEVYTIAPGYHVSFLAGVPDAPMPFDLIEVIAAHRSGPPAQRHSGTTWFHVLEGQLQIIEGDDDRHRSSIVLSPGETHAVPPGVPHTACKAGEPAVRFLIGGRLGTIASDVAKVDCATR
jgi:mannose-6-phosphate isomerase-like protein (cupin superfamily)